MSETTDDETPIIETMDVTALVQRPQHLEAIGTLTVEITHMERGMSEVFSTILGIHFFLGEAIYFTVNSGIARMDIVRNSAELVLHSLPSDLRKVKKLIERAKTSMGKRHAIIHSFWMLAENGEDIYRETLGEFRNRRTAVVSLSDLERQIEAVRRITNDLHKFCNEFQKAHPKDVGTLGTYWKSTST